MPPGVRLRRPLAHFWAGPLQEHSKRPLIAQYAGPWLVHLRDYNEARLVLIGRNKSRRLSFRVKLDGRDVSRECSISQCLGRHAAKLQQVVGCNFRPSLSEMEVAGEGGVKP